MKSPARLGERAPSTSTPSTGVETRSAGDAGAVAVAGAGSGDRHDAVSLGGAYRQRTGGWTSRRTPRAGAGCGRGSLGSRRVRAHRSSAGRPRPAAAPAPARHAPDRVDRRHRRPHHQLVVRRRAADLAGVRASHRAGRARSRLLEVRRRLRVRGRALPLGAAPRGVARGRRPASGLRRQLDHAALPRRDDGDRRAVPAPAPRVLDRRRRPADLDRGRRRVRRRGSCVMPDGLLREAIGPPRRRQPADRRAQPRARACRSTAAGCSRPLVWGASGNQHRGTIVAGWGGRLTALALLAWPLVQEQVIGEPPTILDLVLVFILGLFLWTGATAAMAHARLRQRLPALVARPLARRTLTVPEDLPAGRGRAPRAGGRGGQHRHGRPPTAPPSASSARRR